MRFLFAFTLPYGTLCNALLFWAAMSSMTDVQAQTQQQRRGVVPMRCAHVVTASNGDIRIVPESASACMPPRKTSTTTPTTSDKSDDVSAWGRFDPMENHASGFAILDVKTTAPATNSFKDLAQRYFAAGAVEGYLSAPEIFDMYTDLRESWSSIRDSVPHNLTVFLDEQDAWVRSQIKARASATMPPPFATPVDDKGRRDGGGGDSTDRSNKNNKKSNNNNKEDAAFWAEVGLVQAQFDGLVAGYKQRGLAGKPLPLFAFRLLNGCGDFFDIIPKTCPNERPDYAHMNTPELKRHLSRSGHCSAIVKITPGFEDMLMGHSSWFKYQAMVRVMKNYEFAVAVPSASGGGGGGGGGGDVGKNSALQRDSSAPPPPTPVDSSLKLAFSSYPGFLESLDDFYLSSRGLVMLQTTNNFFVDALYDDITPHAVQAWMRVRAAMSHASSGAEWCAFAGRENGGTYNNQYMVIDTKRFQPGAPLRPGVLWVCEQIPGHWAASDQTDTLARGYWPSYNKAFHKEIYNASGYPAMVRKHGPGLSYELATRAKIFRRDQTNVVDLDGVKAILRYNDYRHDVYSGGDAAESICARGDLTDEHELGGCYDTKVTSWSLAKEMRSSVISGPTTSHDLPPFSWAPYKNITHLGQPALFNFTFEDMSFHH